MTKRPKYNAKRKVAGGVLDQPVLKALLAGVQYSGNPEHKKCPGDFGLTPPSGHRRGKSLCDDTGICRKRDALDLLKEGLMRGTVCERTVNGWPRHIWAVAGDGQTVVEGKRDGSPEGSYHGYPLPESDPIADEVLQRWG